MRIQFALAMASDSRLRELPSLSLWRTRKGNPSTKSCSMFPLFGHFHYINQLRQILYKSSYCWFVFTHQSQLHSDSDPIWWMVLDKTMAFFDEFHPCFRLPSPAPLGTPMGWFIRPFPLILNTSPQKKTCFLVGDVHHLETRQWGCLIYFNIMGMGLTRETELPQLLFLLDILSPSWVLMRYSWILMIIVTIPNCGWLLWHTGDKMAILWRLNWDIRRSNYKPIKPRKIKWNWKKRSTYVVYHHIHHLLILVLQ